VEEIYDLQKPIEGYACCHKLFINICVVLLDYSEM